MKSHLRSQLKSTLDRISPEEHSSKSAEISTFLNSLIGSYSCIASFSPLSLEPKLSLQHPKIVLPRCGKHRTMDFFHIEDPSQLQRGTLGILEPDPNFSTKVSPQDIDAILCPGWGFTLTGARLGKGGGYYDRYLSQTTAIRIGVGYECQVLTKIPTELHDLSMDLLVTDQGVHSLKKS